MTDVKITVGDDVEKDATRRFVDAWHRAERGEFSASGISPSRAGMPSLAY